MNAHHGTSEAPGIGVSTVAILTTVLALVAWAPQVLVAGEQPPAPTTQPAAQASPQRIQELIRQLGDNSFKVREQAQKELTLIGDPAKGELQKAVQSTDAEVQQRATTILGDINKGAFERNSQAIARNLLWTFSIPAGASSSPVVSEGVAYVAGADGKLYAVDAKTGKQVWKFDDVPNGATLTQPLVAEGMVFVSDRTNALYAVDAAKGKLTWKFEFPAPAAGAQPAMPNRQGAAVARPVFVRAGALAGVGGSERPAADGGLVFVTGIDGAKLHALDAKQGRKKWEADLPGQFFGRTAAADGVVCQGFADGALVALDAATGRQLWKSGPSHPCQGLTLSGGAAYLVADGKLQALDAKTGKELWKCDLPTGVQPAANVRMAFVVNNRRWLLGQSDEPPLAVVDGAVYVVSGQQLVAVDAKEGQKKWEYKLDLRGQSDGEQGNAGDDGTVIIAGGGAQVKMQVAVMNGRVITSSGLAGAGPTGPAIGKDAAYIGAANGLHAIDLKTGLRVWRLPTPGPVAGAPVLVDGVIYYATSAQAQVQGDDGAKKDQKDSPGLHALRVKP